MDLVEAQSRLKNLQQDTDDTLTDAMNTEDLDSFVQQYGNRFSNNKQLGLAIMNQLTDNGMSLESITEDAVQTVIDTLRQQCNALLDAIRLDHNKNVEAIHQIQDHLNAVDESIQSANLQANQPIDIAGEPYVPTPASADQMQLPPEQMAAPMPEQLPPEQMAAPMPAEQQLPPEQMAAPIPEQLPPEQMAMSAEQQLPPEQQLSDKRMKQIIGKKSNDNKSGYFRPSAGMIEAASRSF